MAFPIISPINHGIDLNVSTFNPFTLLSFQTTLWDNSISVVAPVLKLNGYNVFVFPIVTPINHGTDITKTNAKKQVSYPTFDFNTRWGIEDDKSYPILLKGDGEFINDPALTSRKIYVFVEKSLDGSLSYDGSVYKSLQRTISSPSVSGIAGANITHQFGGNELNDGLGTVFYYFASGVQDPLYAGGYGDLQPLTQRTVQLRSDRSNNVAFYYRPYQLETPVGGGIGGGGGGGIPNPTTPPPTETIAVPHDYLMTIQGEDVPFHIALFKSEVSSIRVVMNDGKFVAVGLVQVGDPDASPIRVMTETGIYAMKKIDIV